MAFISKIDNEYIKNVNTTNIGPKIKNNFY